VVILIHDLLLDAILPPIVVWLNPVAMRNGTEAAIVTGTSSQNISTQVTFEKNPEYVEWQ
jgi:hypothetical protein